MAGKKRKPAYNVVLMKKCYTFGHAYAHIQTKGYTLNYSMPFCVARLCNIIIGTNIHTEGDLTSSKSKAVESVHIVHFLSYRHMTRHVRKWPFSLLKTQFIVFRISHAK